MSLTSRGQRLGEVLEVLQVQGGQRQVSDQAVRRDHVSLIGRARPRLSLAARLLVKLGGIRAAARLCEVCDAHGGY